MAAWGRYSSQYQAGIFSRALLRVGLGVTGARVIFHMDPCVLRQVLSLQVNRLSTFGWTLGMAEHPSWTDATLPEAWRGRLNTRRSPNRRELRDDETAAPVGPPVFPALRVRHELE